MSPGSFIRSAARVTSSAYRQLPIRWRLAGGSAALTMVILCGFAAVVGALTTRRIQEDFKRDVAASADRLADRVVISYNPYLGKAEFIDLPRLTDYATGGDVIRIVTEDGDWVRRSRDAPFLGPPRPGTTYRDGYLIETRTEFISGLPGNRMYIQYGRRNAVVAATAGRVKIFLGLGVLGGTMLALLAGLATARRAMRPIAELTETARRIERTRDPDVRMPEPEAEDEVAELAHTLDGMLRSLAEARQETQDALERQRRFVADASHELRTPLTSVLANLDLLVDVLEGEERETAASAYRSSQRMRRLVADLLLLARADSGRRISTAEPVDLAEIVADAAAELEPVAGDEHRISVSLEPAPVRGVRDELHRLVLNLLENAISHTDPGTRVEATVRRDDLGVVLAVQDDGPGVPEELRERIFDRFVRGSADRGGSTGLGLAIVKAVAESHGGTVQLAPCAGGARFVVRLPGLKEHEVPAAQDAQDLSPLGVGAMQPSGARAGS